MTAIDHKAEALRLMNSDGSGHGDAGFGKMTDALKDQIAATLYLAEQQRIANLLSLADLTNPAVRTQVTAEARRALTVYRDHIEPNKSGWSELAPDIAQALGLDKEGS